MRHGKIFKRSAAAVLSAVMLSSFAAAKYYSGRLPETVTAGSGSVIRIAEYPELSSEGAQLPSSGERSVTLSLFGAIPVKNVTVHEAEPSMLIACGEPFGIKLLMEGVMVTGLGEVESSGGDFVCPAEAAGIEAGDVICLAGGEEVNSNSRLQRIISESGGRDIDITVSRSGRRFTTSLTPVKSASSGEWRGGMWVRDSIAGIGTMTFADAETGEFAGLGHPICDSDTGELVPIQSGEAVPVEITETKHGEKGIPGELRGQFISGRDYGSLTQNSESGIYGKLNTGALDELISSSEEYPLGGCHEIKTGSAEILATVHGSSPERYSIEIESVDLSGGEDMKDMVIRITDSRLLEAAGGIVQGMSGSPIIQDGKLIGAVTHVFVADPTRGYGIFAESMVKGMRG